jgi:hypothetical protein
MTPIVIHRATLYSPRLANYTTEKIFYSLFIKWPWVFVPSALYHFALAGGVAKGQALELFWLAHFDCNDGASVEELQELIVNRVDFRTPIFDSHLSTPYRRSSCHGRHRCKTKTDLSECGPREDKLDSQAMAEPTLPQMTLVSESFPNASAIEAHK